MQPRSPTIVSCRRLYYLADHWNDSKTSSKAGLDASMAACCDLWLNVGAKAGERHEYHAISHGGVSVYGGEAFPLHPSTYNYFLPRGKSELL